MKPPGVADRPNSTSPLRRFRSIRAAGEYSLEVSPTAAIVIVVISLALILVMAGNSREGFRAISSIAAVAAVLIVLAGVIALLMHH